jgi:hypothetical protein
MSNSVTDAVAVQAILGSYTHALDAGRTDDIVALFCADGSVELEGIGTFRGHDAIRGIYQRLVPEQPQLHATVNTVVTLQTEDQAMALSDFAFCQRSASGWVVQVVGHYEDILRRQNGAWLFQHRKTTYTQ